MLVEHDSQEYVETIKTNEFVIYIFKQDTCWSLLFSLDLNMVDVDPYQIEQLAEDNEDELEFLFFPNYKTRSDALKGLGEALFDHSSDFFYVDTLNLTDEAVFFIGLVTHSEYSQSNHLEAPVNFEDENQFNRGAYYG